MTFDFERFALENARREFGIKIEPQSPRDHRACECCDRTAWHDPSQDSQSGVRVFMCSHGHVLIVAPIQVEG